MGVQKSKKRRKTYKVIKLKINNCNPVLHKKVKNTGIKKINNIDGIIV